MNIKVNDLAKKALLYTHTSNKFFNGLFPLDEFVISVDG
jgi:hypothetical protein